MILSVIGERRGFSFVFLYLLLTSASCISISKDIRDVHDLCRIPYNKRLFGLDDNSSFKVDIHSEPIQYGSGHLMSQKTKKCNFMLKVCSSCHVSVLIQNMTIPPCFENCNCNHFEIKEPLSDFSSQKYCGNRSNEIQFFVSKTKVISFNFVQNLYKIFHVSLTINVSRNMYLFTEDSGSSRPKYIETPYFPAGYPSDYLAEYVFQAKPPMGYVELLFVDFQLSRDSYIEVTGHDGTRIAVYNGDVFRPPPIISQGPMLRLRFLANDQPSRSGFTAMYMFGHNVGDYRAIQPETDCGGNKDGYGGVIQTKVHHMVDQLYDCIWLIHPPLFSEQSLLSASVLEFENIGQGASLEFRQGLTSKSHLVQVYRCEQSSSLTCSLDLSEVLVHAETGLFIRFRGALRQESSLVMNYYTFKENNCTSDQMICNNKRCMNKMLLCDGYKHCPDGSDELNCSVSPLANTTLETTSIESKPDQIPKTSVHSNNVTGFFAFVVLGSCGVLAIILMVAYICYNHFKQHQQTDTMPLHVLQGPHGFGNPVVISRTGPCEDILPSYDDVLAFNERYPPLFYTRKKRFLDYNCRSSSWFGDKILGTSSACLGQGNPLSVSECDICPEALLHASDSFVINLSCSVSSYELLNIGTKRLRRSLSLDLNVKKCPCTTFCSCKVSVNSSSKFLRRTKSCSAKVTPFTLKSHISISESPVDFEESFGNVSRSYSCSFVTQFPIYKSDLVLSIQNNAEFTVRPKTNSF